MTTCDTVSVFDTEAMAVAASITTGSGPHGVVVDTTGETAWVTNLYDDTVSVLDLTTVSYTHLTLPTICSV